MKAQFLSTLRLEDIDGKHMRVIAPFRFYSAELGEVVMVLPGYVTDFASIPRGFWNVFPKNDVYDYAAVLHDAAYNRELKDRRKDPLYLTKPQADALFREAMQVRGVGKVKRNLMYLAVKFFGKGEFRQDHQ